MGMLGLEQVAREPQSFVVEQELVDQHAIGVSRRRKGADAQVSEHDLSVVLEDLVHIAAFKYAIEGVAETTLISDCHGRSGIA